MTIQRGTPDPQKYDIDRLIEEYRSAKEFAESAQKRVTQYRNFLVEVLQASGTADHKGNLWIDRDNTSAKYERRVSTRLDAEQLSEWAQQSGHWDDIIEVQEVIVEDKVLALAFENPDLAPEINACYKETETWALKIVDRKIGADE